MWMPMLNKSLADKVVAIHVFANGYKLEEIRLSDFYVDRSSLNPQPLDHFSPEELADPWVRVRSNYGSTFHLRFFEQTPLRLFPSRMIKNSLYLSRRRMHLKNVEHQAISRLAAQ